MPTGPHKGFSPSLPITAEVHPPLHPSLPKIYHVTVSANVSQLLVILFITDNS